MIATLGRLDQVSASGQLDRLIAGLARFSEHLRVVSVDRGDALAARTAKSWGPALIFGRLWERQELPGILGRLSAHRKFGFDVERVAFALALQRLVAPGSDRQGAGWLETIEAPGFETIRLHQMYRTVAALAELERELFLADRDLFSGGLDLVCMTPPRAMSTASMSTTARCGGAGRGSEGICSTTHAKEGRRLLD